MTLVASCWAVAAATFVVLLLQLLLLLLLLSCRCCCQLATSSCVRRWNDYIYLAWSLPFRTVWIFMQYLIVFSNLLGFGIHASKIAPTKINISTLNQLPFLRVSGWQFVKPTTKGVRKWFHPVPPVVKMLCKHLLANLLVWQAATAN